MTKLGSRSPRRAAYPSSITGISRVDDDGSRAASRPPRPAAAAVVARLAAFVCLACLLLASAPLAAQPAAARLPATPSSSAPLEASILVAAPARLDAIASRLTGHRVRRGDHALLLEDIAGLGRPWVGTVASRCGQLWLDTAVRSLLLTGPLARPRLAGPGYLLWAVGRLDPSGPSLELDRLGVLARPGELPASTAPGGTPPPCPRS